MQLNDGKLAIRKIIIIEKTPKELSLSTREKHIKNSNNKLNALYKLSSTSFLSPSPSQSQSRSKDNIIKDSPINQYLMPIKKRNMNPFNQSSMSIISNNSKLAQTKYKSSFFPSSVDITQCPQSQYQWQSQSQSMRNSNKDKSISLIAKTRKLPKINYYNPMKKKKDDNPIKQRLENLIYKTPKNFIKRMQLIKSNKHRIKLEKYHEYLIDAANKTYSKETVAQLGKTFTSMRNSSSMPHFEKCRYFIRKLEEREKPLMQKIQKAKVKLNKAFSLYCGKTKNIMDILDMKHYGILNKSSSSLRK